MFGHRIFSFLMGRVSRPPCRDGARASRFLSDEELIGSINQAALKDARELMKTGADVELILFFLRDRGFDQIDSIIAIKALTGMSHDEAKKLVTTCKAWSDRFDSVQDLHDKAHKALLELAASGEIELTQFDEEEPS